MCDRINSNGAVYDFNLILLKLTINLVYTILIKILCSRYLLNIMLNNIFRIFICLQTSLLIMIVYCNLFFTTLSL